MGNAMHEGLVAAWDANVGVLARELPRVLRGRPLPAGQDITRREWTEFARVVLFAKAPNSPSFATHNGHWLARCAILMAFGGTQVFRYAASFI